MSTNHKSPSALYFSCYVTRRCLTLKPEASFQMATSFQVVYLPHSQIVKNELLFGCLFVYMCIFVGSCAWPYEGQRIVCGNQQCSIPCILGTELWLPGQLALTPRVFSVCLLIVFELLHRHWRRRLATQRVPDCSNWSQWWGPGQTELLSTQVLCLALPFLTLPYGVGTSVSGCKVESEVTL